MDKIVEITVLTAVYNDWESLSVLLVSLDKELSNHSLSANVIVVDDGSFSSFNLDELNCVPLTFIKSIKVVTLTRNLGNQRAVAVGIGFLAANQLTNEYLVVMDSDLEDQPKYVPLLVQEAMKDHGEQIIFAERSRRSEGALFSVFYSIYKRTYKLLTGLPIAIGNFSAIPHRLVKRVAGVSEIWSHFPAGIMRARIRYRSIPSTRGKRIHGRSAMNFVSLILHGLSGLAVHADVVGVRIILGIFGFLIFAMSAMAAITPVPELKSLLLDGWTFQIILILGLVLLQIFISVIFLGFLLLNGKMQNSLIPYVDYEKFILDVDDIIPNQLDASESSHANTKILK